MDHQALQVLDILGTVAFAVSGVLAAMHEKLDLFGVLIIAFVTAVGGGTLRDVLIGSFPVSWMQNIGYTIIILLTAFMVMPFNQVIGNFKRTLLLFDSVGLGFFTIAGVQKGMAFDLHPGICIVLGTVTACFGGVIRDTLLNNIPLIFRREIYASACIIGGSGYLLLHYFHLSGGWTEAFCILMIVLIRLLAVKYNWQLPNIYGKKNGRFF